MGTHRSGYYKTSYSADLALFDTPWRKLALAIVIGLLAAVPHIAAVNNVYVMDRLFIVIIGALALNLLTGYAGLISLGHAAFLAVGAFFSYYLSTLGVPFVIVVPLVMASGAVLGVIVGIPALRLRGLYLILATIGFHYVVIFLINIYQTSGSNMLQALTGLILPTPDIGFTVLDTPLRWYYFLLAILILVTAYCINLVRTRPGRAWIAIRDRDITAAALGIDIARYKVLAFAVSSALACLAGALLAYFLQSVSAEYFTLSLAIDYLAMVVIGGAGSIMGAYCGAIFVTMIPYVIRWLFNAVGAGPQIQLTYVVPSYQILFGCLMIVFLLAEPRGLVGIWHRVLAYFDLWPLRQSILGERKR